MDSIEKLERASELIEEAADEIGAGLIVGQLTAALIVVGDAIEFLAGGKEDPPTCDLCGQTITEEYPEDSSEN